PASPNTPSMVSSPPAIGERCYPLVWSGLPPMSQASIRTRLGPLPAAFRAGGEPYHVGDLPDEFNREEAILARADTDAIDEAAKDFKRLGFRRGVNERVLQAGDLLPIEFR